MNIIKFAKRTLLSTVITTIAGTTLIADTIEIKNQIKDIKVMAKILETSLDSSAEDFPGSPNVRGTYLPSQGYLFEIQLNGIGGFGVPGIASWDGGRVELDIPELITEALSAISDDTGTEAPDVVFESLNSLQNDDELQSFLRDNRDKQRDLRHEAYKIKRSIRKADSEVQKTDLQRQLAEIEAKLKKYKEEYNEHLTAHRKERNDRRIAKSSKAVNEVFNTICDYGQSLRALGKNEKITLIIKGGVDNEGNNTSQVYVLNQESVRSCDNGLKLKNASTNYMM